MTKVVGFGACMISGEPFPGDASFFRIAMGILEKHLPGQIESACVSIGGFPAPRAAQHLKSKALSLYPRYVVVQFGSTDALAPLRRRRTRSVGLRPVAARPLSDKAATPVDSLRWIAGGVAARLLRVPPITSEKDYVLAIRDMAAEILQSGAVPVILSPFVLGPGQAKANARRYERALQKAIGGRPDIIYIDAFRELSLHPEREVLLADGLHMTRKAHGIVAGLIAEAIRQSVAK